MIRSAAFLLGGNLVSWAVSIAFWLVVPRIIGPTEWGEFNLGLAFATLAFSIGGLGIMTFLVKEIARNRERSSELVGASIATHLALSVVIAGGVALFAFMAPYSPHTRTVVLLATGVAFTAFLVGPAFSAMQALEKMRLASIVYTLRQVLPTLAAVLAAVLFKPDIAVLIIVMLVSNVVVSVLQLGAAHRIVPIRFRFDRALSRWLVFGGLPFWSNSIFVTIYIWIDSVLLSVLVSTREVGYYAAPGQIMATLGFLPAIVTFVIFPALSSGFRADFERVRHLTRVSLSVLISLGLPISIGLALVGPNAIQDVFGPAYKPSGPAMIVMALTVVPSYIATLAYWVLAAVDRQRSWAYVMGVMAIVNPLINLLAIPYFQARFQHGSIGAAVALLITDVVVCAAGLALMPREYLRPVLPLLTFTARVGFATLAMAIPVWFLRHRFLPIPVLVGVGVFGAAALALGVFRSEGYAEVWGMLRAKVRKRLGRRSEVNVPA